MDDQCFDQASAQDWITVVESRGAALRDTDIYPRIRSWVRETSPRDLLDIGCGQGVCGEKIDLTGRTYTGVDPSAFMIDRAKALSDGERRAFVVGNAYSLPFENSAFDGAFAVAVWHLLGDLAQAALELARVLRPAGGFLIITANPSAYSLWTARYSSSTVDGRRFDGRTLRADGSWAGDTLYLHTFAEITGALRTAGLEVAETEALRASAAPGVYQYLSLRGRKA